MLSRCPLAVVSVTGASPVTLSIAGWVLIGIAPEGGRARGCNGPPGTSRDGGSGRGLLCRSGGRPGSPAGLDAVSEGGCEPWRRPGHGGLLPLARWTERAGLTSTRGKSGRISRVTCLYGSWCPHIAGVCDLACRRDG